MSQRALIIERTRSGEPLDALNDHLDQGWTVVHTCPMPSAKSNTSTREYVEPTCLVIIQSPPAEKPPSS